MITLKFTKYLTTDIFVLLIWQKILYMILDIDLYLIDRLHIPVFKALFVVALKISRYCN